MSRRCEIIFLVLVMTESNNSSIIIMFICRLITLYLEYIILLFLPYIHLVSLAEVKLNCEKLEGGCLNNSKQRMCTCTSAGAYLRWSTNRPRVFYGGNNGAVVYDRNSSIFESKTELGFTVFLNSNIGDILNSTLTFTSKAVSDQLGIEVTCDDTVYGNQTSAVTQKLTVHFTGFYYSIILLVLDQSSFHSSRRSPV